MISDLDVKLFIEMSISRFLYPEYKIKRNSALFSAFARQACLPKLLLQDLMSSYGAPGSTAVLRQDQLRRNGRSLWSLWTDDPFDGGGLIGAQLVPTKLTRTDTVAERVTIDWKSILIIEDTALQRPSQAATPYFPHFDICLIKWNTCFLHQENETVNNEWTLITINLN